MSDIVPPEPDPPKPPATFKELRVAAKHSFMEWLDWTKPFLLLVRDEAKHMRGGWVLFSVLAAFLVGITIWTVHWADSYYFAREPQQIRLDPSDLEARVEAKLKERDKDAWPPLTASQIDEWAVSLSPYNLKEITMMWGSEVNAKVFYDSIKVVGKRIGCRVVVTGGNTDANVIEIATAPNAPEGRVLVELFAKLNCKAVWNHVGSLIESGHVWVAIPEKQ